MRSNGDSLTPNLHLFKKGDSKLPKHVDFYGDPLQWLTSYLKIRQQFVEVNGVKQNYSPFHMVPPGSLLGQVFFSISVNDFADTASTGEDHLDADDTTAFRLVTGNTADQVVEVLNIIVLRLLIVGIK